MSGGHVSFIRFYMWNIENKRKLKQINELRTAINIRNYYL